MKRMRCHHDGPTINNQNTLRREKPTDHHPETTTQRPPPETTTPDRDPETGGGALLVVVFFGVRCSISPLCPSPRTVKQIRCSIVVSISACHAEDPGSIPGGGALMVVEEQSSSDGVPAARAAPSTGRLGGCRVRVVSVLGLVVRSGGKQVAGGLKVLTSENFGRQFDFVLVHSPSLLAPLRPTPWWLAIPAKSADHRSESEDRNDERTLFPAHPGKHPWSSGYDVSLTR